jgi:uncharacterized protein involved in outer membrane biogenesis
MALSRSTKIWLVILGIPLLLLIGGAVALKILFSGDRLKGYLIPAIEEATGRTVTIADVSLSVFPSIAVEVDTLSISNAAGEGFSERPFCRLDRLVLDVNLIPLLSGRVEVPTILLEHPVLLLEVSDQGLTNYDFGTQEEEPPAAGDTTGFTGSGLVLSAFEVRNGVLEYVNHKENSATRLQEIRLLTEIELDPAARSAGVSLDAGVGSFSYGSVESPLLSGLPISLVQQLTYSEAADSLSLGEGKALFGTIPLTVSGFVAGMSKTPRVDLAVRSSGAKIPDLLSLVPREYMKDAEGFEGTGTAEIGLSIKGVISDSTETDVTGLVSSTDAQVRYSSLPKPITNISIVADFTKTAKKQEFRVTKFSANLGANPVSATLTVVNFDDPSMNLSLNASLNLAEVKDYYPLEEGTELSGQLKADVKVSGRINDPKTRKSSGVLDLKSVGAKTEGSANPVRNLNGTITFNDQTIDAKKVTMMVGKSDFDIAFTLRNYLGIFSDDEGDVKPTATLRLNSNHLLTADLTSEDNGKKTDGKGNAQQGGGLPFPGVSMEISASIGTLTMERFELRNVRAAMSIADGIVTLRNFSGNVYNGSVATKGTLDMRDPKETPFDLTLEMNNMDVHQFLPEFTSFGSRLYGNLTMTTGVQGALDDTLGLIPQTLNGGGNVQMKSGKVDGVKMNQALAGMLSLPDLSVVNFKDWQNSFTIANGRLVLKDLKIAALNSDYTINGSMGFDGSIDYAMTLLLPPETSSKIKLPGVTGFAGQAVDLFKDPSGRIRLDFAVTGTSDSPKVSLNTDAAQKKAEDLAKQKLEAEKKKLEDELKKKAGDILKDFDPFKKDGP